MHKGLEKVVSRCLAIRFTLSSSYRLIYTGTHVFNAAEMALTAAQ
jgi:hypothetical protein